ncbi:hypothetical protein [Subtercola endophyticus]|uniref:hypothetical protein n=1 Tax=Subtercola endophyticus TaxID=2895559 RepID=UPI001E36DF3E|nr:hypothetical protein [Subtercola endophyticus]UFS58936.1 hypothetical protein LQ955_18395 [Subtercola endophyticus]
MKRLAIPFVVVALLLAGCTSTAQTGATPAAVEVTSTPTPTPTVLTTDAAGKLYLSAVCPSNTAADGLTAALKGDDLPTVVAAAGKISDTSRAGALILDDPMTIWPDSVATDIKTVRDQLLAQIQYASQVAAAATVSDANFVIYKGSGDPVAAQRIRLHLNLPSDTTC